MIKFSRVFIVIVFIFFSSLLLSSPFSVFSQDINNLKKEDDTFSTGSPNAKLPSLPKRLSGEIYNEKKGEQNYYVEGEVLVKYKSQVINLKNSTGKQKEKNYMDQNGLEVKETIKDLNISVLKIKDSKSVKEKISELENDPAIEYVQPNFQYYPTSINTNDPYRSLLWGLDNTGQTVGGLYAVHKGTLDKDIDIPEAWGINTGNNGTIIVAVIDIGVNYNHPDLINNMWDGTSCKNVDGSPLGGCQHGYDFENSDTVPLPNTIVDSHGTHIAGTIAATSNNGIGISGIAPNSKIMALKTNLTTSQLISAIMFAENNNAKVINASWGAYGITGNSSYDNAMYNAIANFSGLFIAAVGNSNFNQDDGLDIHKNYPSGFKITTTIGEGLENIITVTATDQNDNLASFSDYGINSVDIGAPGTNIHSTIPYDEIILENFETITAGKIPSGWIKGGTNNYWGVIEDDGEQGNLLSSTSYIPYANNTNSTVTSPTYPLTGNNAYLYFYTSCDTEYNESFWTDYMTLEFSLDGITFNQIARWDEASIDNDSYSTGAARTFYFEPIPNQYITNKFKFRFRWVTNSSNNYYNGCFIDDFEIITDFPTYGYSDGTSMAAPHISGLAALIWGYQPTLTYSEVKNAILQNGDTVASLTGKTTTGKRANAYKSLSAITALDHIDISPVGTQTLYTGESLNFTANAKDVNNHNIFRDGYIWTETNSSGTFSASTPGTYSVKATKEGVDSNTTNVIVSPAFSAQRIYYSGVGNWNTNATKFMTNGDFNNDGIDDIAAMYDYGKGKMAIFSFQSNGSTMSTKKMFTHNAWNVSSTKFLTSGDFNNDGIDDIAAMYDYGRGKMALFVFQSNGSTLTKKTVFTHNAWNVPSTKFITPGDFNNDGIDDIAAMYDYGKGKMAIFSFQSNGSTMSKRTVFTHNAWNVPSTKFLTSGDYNNDNIDDVSAMYDYGRGKMALFVFQSNGSTLTKKTVFTHNAWNVPSTKFITSGDFNNDGIDDIAAMYDYGKGKMAIFSFQSNGSTMSKRTVFTHNAWNVPSTKFLTSGDYNNDTYTNLGAMYNYGNNTMGLFRF